MVHGTGIVSEAKEMKDADYWIRKLKMEEHPEGGWFRETYRCPESVSQEALPAGYDGGRAFSTAIFFLLTANRPSRIHRLKSDEIWHFYAGDPLTIHMFDSKQGHTRLRLGPNPDRGETFQALVPRETWFGACVERIGGYALAGCTVSPGFDFRDFEMGDRETLMAEFPAHGAIIGKLAK